MLDIARAIYMEAYMRAKIARSRKRYMGVNLLMFITV